MREIRPSGSEGGGADFNHLSLPLYGPTVAVLESKRISDSSATVTKVVVP